MFFLFDFFLHGICILADKKKLRYYKKTYIIYITHFDNYFYHIVYVIQYYLFFCFISLIFLSNFLDQFECEVFINFFIKLVLYLICLFVCVKNKRNLSSYLFEENILSPEKIF